MTIKNNRYTFLAAACLIGSGLLYSCSSSKGKGEEKAAEKPAVEILSLQTGKLSSSIRIPGELLSYRDVDLYAKISSFAKQLYVDVGSEVQEGQMLALMDAPEIVSQLAVAESRLNSQQAIYKASKATYDRLLETSKTPGTVSQNDLDLALSKMNSDYAQLQAAEAAHKEVTVLQNYLEIRAPFSGIISARNVTLGAYVGPSGKGSEYPMFTLNEQKKLRLVVYVPEAYTSYLHQGDDIKFTVKAYPNDKFTANVKRMAGAMDKRLRSQRIEMDVVNDNKKLLPNMLAEVILNFSAAENTLVVPKTAVVNSPERVFVIRIVDHKAEWVNVKAGREAKGEIEIFGDLKPGDQVVAVASEELRDGTEVPQTKPFEKKADKE